MASQQEVVERIFDAALSLDPTEREAFLDRECKSDPEIRRVVEELLADDARAGSFLQHPPFEHLDKAALFEQLLAGETASRGSTAAAPPPSPAEQLNPGKVLLDRFVVVRFIAKGGMGEVYEVEDLYLQRKHVALKTILPHIAHNPSLRERFEREVLLAREVTHPNLCPIYEIFHCEEQPPGFLFLTMKLLPGTTLAQRLRQSPSLSVDEKISVVRQISAGLIAIHDSGIVHRDIKPSNIMLDGGGTDLRLWITDFGLARVLEFETTLQSRGVAGTPGYIAPELNSGHAPSQASDLYAFGVVLHELFTGEKPATAADGVGVIISPKLSSSGAPSFCVQLVRGCLDLDPRRRCEAFDHVLVSLGLKRRQRKPWTRRQFLATAAAGVCALGGVGWWEWDKIEDLTHPIPQKRFVALLSWPKTSDNHVLPMLTGALNAIKGELARLEAYDRNLFVISPEDLGEDPAAVTYLAEICEPLGANLVLAASGITTGSLFELVLRLLNPITGHPLREKRLTCAFSKVTSLPAKAVQAAASLLNVSQYLKSSERTEPGTQSVAAFTAFQQAETLRRQPNDSGLSAAIDKYKEAIDLDSHYAMAHANLAQAYVRQYVIRRDPGVLDLARANSERALALEPDLAAGHLARAVVLEWTGDEQGALDEMAKSLALDPSDPKALLWQAQIYDRLNRWSEAERTYRRVVAARPNSWVAYNELGILYQEEGRYKEAVQGFRSASAAAPRSALALSNLGTAYLQTGEVGAATESLKKSLALAPDFDEALANMSLALRYQGAYEQALLYALKAARINPRNDANWLELGDCYSSINNRKGEAKNAYLKAAEEAERHLQTDQSNGPGWMLLALYRVKSGTPQDALSLIQRAESLNAGDMDSQLYKARILEQIGRRDDALATLQVCFRKGASPFQISPFPDMQALRKDPRYQQLVRSKEGGQQRAASSFAKGSMMDSS